MDCFIRLILATFFYAASLEAYSSNSFEPSFEEISIAANLYQEDWKIAETDKKIYIKSSAIVLEDDKIYLHIGPFLVQIPSLHSDSSGIYMCAEGWLSWECCRCGYSNSKRCNCCQRCHKARC